MSPAGNQEERINLFVVGAQKAGTTALWRWLAQQPDVAAPEKEPHFFDRPERYQNGSAAALAAYQRPYSALGPHRYRADCTPIYLYLPEIPERLARYNPDARLIAVLRHPADRAISHWAMEKRKGKESLALAPALVLEPWRRRGGTHRVHSYLHRGFYSAQLARLLQHFPREQLLLLQAEQMRREPAATARTVRQFLGLSEHTAAAIGQAHTGDYRSPHPLIRSALARIYGRELRRLAQQYGLRW